MFCKSRLLTTPSEPSQKWVKPRLKCCQLAQSPYLDGLYYYAGQPREQLGNYPVYHDGIIGWNANYKIVLASSYSNWLYEEELNPDSTTTITDLVWESSTIRNDWTCKADSLYLSNYFTIIAMAEGTDLSSKMPYGKPMFKQFPVTRYTITNEWEDIIQKDSLQDGFVKVDRNQTFIRNTSPTPSLGGVIQETYTITAYCDAFPQPIVGKTYTCIEMWCFTKNTRILLGDGSWKTADQLTMDDVVACWDFDKGEMTSSPLLWLLKRRVTNRYYKITTNSGRVFENVGNHRLFSLTTNKFERCLDMLNHKVWTIDGEETIVNIECCDQTIDYYNAISANHMNLITDGFLSSCGFNNLYPIENMKYIKQPRQHRSIEMYGDIPQEWYDSLRLGEHYCDPKDVKPYVDRCIRNGC